MYNDFSEVYDRLIDADYSKFVSYYNKIFDRFLGKKPELLLDLGCGTGSLTSLLKKDGYDMIGVDASYDMLMRAREKDPDILYLNQDMTDFELYGTVGAAVSSLDCINYLLEDGELLIQREISTTGKNKCRINGRPATVSTLPDYPPQYRGFR